MNKIRSKVPKTVAAAPAEEKPAEEEPTEKLVEAKVVEEKPAEETPVGRSVDELLDRLNLMKY